MAKKTVFTKKGHKLSKMAKKVAKMAKKRQKYQILQNLILLFAQRRLFHFCTLISPKQTQAIYY